jgi:hypothetical protein
MLGTYFSQFFGNSKKYSLFELNQPKYYSTYGQKLFSIRGWARADYLQQYYLLKMGDLGEK